MNKMIKILLKGFSHKNRLIYDVLKGYCQENTCEELTENVRGNPFGKPLEITVDTSLDTDDLESFNYIFQSFHLRQIIR